MHPSLSIASTNCRLATRSFAFRSLIAAAAAAVLGTASAHAATYDWLPTTVGPFAWDNAGGQVNWSIPGFPDAVADIANVTSDIVTTSLLELATVEINSEITVGTLNIGDANGSAAFNLQGGILGSLILNNNAAPAQLNQTATSAGDFINVPIITSGALNVTNAGIAPLFVNGLVATSAAAGVQLVTVEGNVRFNGEISDGFAGGQLGLAKNGGGSLFLSGPNTFSGGVTVNGGTLDLGNSTALGASGNTLQLNAGTMLANTSGFPVTLTNQYTQAWLGDFAYSGPNDLDMGTGIVATLGSRAITVSAGTLAVNGSIVESGGSAGITKLGSGTLVFGAANDYSGPTLVSGGILAARHKDALGTAAEVAVGSGATLMLDGGVTVTGKTLTISGDGAPTQLGALRGVNGDNVWAGDILATTNPLVRIVAGSGTLTINGNIITSGISANGVVFQGSGTVNGVISGDGSITRSNNDAGTWTLNGANTFTGATLVSNGALQLGNKLALQNSALTLNSVVQNGLLFGPGTTEVDLISLSGAAAANFSLNNADSTPVTLTLNIAAAGAATFNGAIHGSGKLVKQGTGTQTLTGSSTFTGGIMLNEGILTASDPATVPASGTAVKNGLGAGTTTLATGTTLNLRANGTNDVSQQRLVFGSDLALSGAATVNVNRNAGSGSGKILSFGKITLGPDAFTVTSGNNYALQIASAVLAANATINSATATGNVILGNVTQDTDGRSLTKDGPGRLTIVGDAVHTGGTTVNAGTLQVGFGTNSGSIGGNIVNNGNVTFSRSDTSTYPGQISGTGSLTKSGSGTVVLTGANTYTGNTTVTNGTLLLDFANTASILSSTSPLILGGALYMKGAPSGTTSQVLGNFTGTAALPTKLVVDSNGGAGTTLMLGNTWAMNAGNAIHIDLSKGGAVASTPTVNNSVIVGNGAVARVAVTGTDGRTYFGTHTGGLVARLTSLTALTSASNSATTNFQASGDLTTNGAVATATLRIDTTGGAGSLDLNGGLSFGRTALLMDGAGDFEIKTTSGLGTIANAVVHQFGTGALTYSAPIASGGFTKGGPGLLIGNMPSGAPSSPTITDGVYRAAVSTAVPVGSLTISGGIFELGSGDYNPTALGTEAGQVRVIGDGGFSAFGATRVVTIGAGGSIAWDQANFLPGNSTLQLSSRHANATIDFRNPLLLGGITRVVQVNNGSAEVDAILSGAVGGTAEFVKSGPGTLALTAANTFSGLTRIRDGVLQIDGSLSGSVLVAQGALQGAGDGFATGVIAGGITVGDGIGTSDAAISAGNGVGRLTSTGLLTFGGDAEFKFDLNSELTLADEMFANGLTIGAGATFRGVENGAPFSLVIGTPFVALFNTSLNPISGTFANLPEGGFIDIGLTTFQATYFGGDGNDLELTAVIPEPATFTAILLGLPVLALRRRRNSALR